MKNFSRFVSILIIVLLSVSLFGACGGNGNSSDSASKVDPNLVINTADISFIDTDGESTYRVVRPENGSDDTASAANAVFKGFKEKIGVTPKNVQDSEDGKDKAEILVGNTNREASAKAKELLLSEGTGRGNEYIIATIDDDIVIYGITDKALIAGVDYFIKTYLATTTVEGGIHYFFSSIEGFKILKLFGQESLYNIKIVRPIYNVSYLTQIETDNLTAAILETTGFSLEQVKDQIASTTGNNDDGSGTLTPTTPAEYEIIIGNAVRDGVKTDLGRNAYEIRIEDKKIYLNGGSPAATAMAVSEFTKIVKTNTDITAKNSVLSGDYNATVKGYDPKTTYVRTWGDDFDTMPTDDGSGINYEIWDVRWDERSGYRSAANGKSQYRGSSELQNNYVKDGLMYQIAVETKDAYYGGMWTTMNMMEYREGYLEISTIHPKGMGFWTALWTNSSIPLDEGPFPDPERMYFCEVDVEECYGPGTWVYGNTFALRSSYGHSIYGSTGNEGAVHVNNRLFCEDDRGYYLDFHTFGYEWISNTKVRFTCDGYVYADQDLREGPEQYVFTQPQYIRLSLACGSGNHGQPTEDETEWTKYNKFIADWVHLYQKEGQGMWKTDNRVDRNWTQVR